MEVFDDLDKVGADVVLLHSCSQSCGPNPVKSLLEVYEDSRGLAGAGDISRTGIFRLKICPVVLLPALKPVCSSAMIFSACSFNLFNTIFRMTFLSPDTILPSWLGSKLQLTCFGGWSFGRLQVVFLRKCNDQGPGPRGWPFSYLPDLVADYCESGDYILSTCLDQFCWDVVNSSWLSFL